MMLVISVLIVILFIFAAVCIIAAILFIKINKNNEEDVNLKWVRRLYSPNYRPYKNKIIKTDKDIILGNMFSQKYIPSAENKINEEVYSADLIEDVLIEYEQAIKEEITNQRFFIWEKEREKYLKLWAKFIPNPTNGGDDDFIVFDSYRGEYTFGENGVTPLCNEDELNDYYKNDDLNYIIRQPRN